MKKKRKKKNSGYITITIIILILVLLILLFFGFNSIKKNTKQLTGFDILNDNQVVVSSNFNYDNNERIIVELKDDPLIIEQSKINEEINIMREQNSNQGEQSVNTLDSGIKIKEQEQENIKNNIIENHKNAINDINSRLYNEALPSISPWQNILNYITRVSENPL